MAESVPRAQCPEVDLVVFVRDERPDAIAEFSATGDDHESDRAIDLPGRVPAFHEVFNARTHPLPDRLGRTPDHFRGEHRIDLERGEDGLRAYFLLFLVSSGEPLACEQDRLLPSAFVQDVSSKRVP